MSFIRVFLTALLFHGTIASAAAPADHQPGLVSVSLNKAFVPVGFDDNDVVQVTVAGELSSSCEKVGPTEFSVEEATKVIRVKQTAYAYQGICLSLPVPFTQVLSLGILAKGDYSLVDEKTGASIGKLPVTASSKSEPDDHLYAPIGDAYIGEGTSTENGRYLILKGTFSDRCTSLKEVKVGYFPGSIVVQPIAERKEQEGGCEAQRVPFQRNLTLPSGLIGTFLVHVRSMNGQAVNKVVELD